MKKSYLSVFIASLLYFANQEASVILLSLSSRVESRERVIFVGRASPGRSENERSFRLDIWGISNIGELFLVIAGKQLQLKFGIKSLYM